MTVADASGAENDLSELVTYVNDAVFMAPSMLLAGDVRWAAVDERSFDVTIGDHGRQVTARVVTDPSGAPVDFSTGDRWCDLPGGPVRTRWSTPVEGRVMPHGRWQPTRGSAIWHLPEGPFRYADFHFAPGVISYNVPPAALLVPEHHGTRGGLAQAVRRLRNWGATEHEQRAELPGDELVPGEASVTTRAVTIQAPAEQVWRWLVQIGQDRGGMYSYDWLENLAGQASAARALVMVPDGTAGTGR